MIPMADETERADLGRPLSHGYPNERIWSGHDRANPRVSGRHRRCGFLGPLGAGAATCLCRDGVEPLQVRGPQQSRSGRVVGLHAPAQRLLALAPGAPDRPAPATAARYRHLRIVHRGTRATQVAIGVRKAPAPQGLPGYIRIDTVHQGDQDGAGLYHINAVDIVLPSGRSWPACSALARRTCCP